MSNAYCISRWLIHGISAMAASDHGHDLGNEGERLLLNLRDRLQQRDEDADDQPDDQHRRGDRPAPATSVSRISSEACCGDMPGTLP